MNRKRLLITEDEKKYILSMYGIIKENNQGNPQKTIESSDFFDSGKHSKLSEKGINELTRELGEALTFMRENEGKIISIKILASEDKNQNYDHEQTPYVMIPTKQLAIWRAETMKKFLTKFFEDQIRLGKLQTMPIFEEPEIVVGTGITSAQQKFDRRVEISFTIIGESTTVTTTSTPPCSRNLRIRVFYNKKDHGGHNCNSAVFEVDINGQKMYRDRDGEPFISLNNAGILDNKGVTIKQREVNGKKEYWPWPNSLGGTEREDFITLTNEKLDSIPNVNKKLSISFTCRNLNQYIPTVDALYKHEDFNIPMNQWRLEPVIIPGGYVIKPGATGTTDSDKITIDPKQYTYYPTQLTYISNYWYHPSNWKFDCHDGVGGIQFINENGQVSEEFTVKTPKLLNKRKFMLSINPCTLEVIEVGTND